MESTSDVPDASSSNLLESPMQSDSFRHNSGTHRKESKWHCETCFHDEWSAKKKEGSLKKGHPLMMLLHDKVVRFVQSGPTEGDEGGVQGLSGSAFPADCWP